jgi:hypothetical protein
MRSMVTKLVGALNLRWRGAKVKKPLKPTIRDEVTCRRQGDKYEVRGTFNGRTVFKESVSYYETESTKQRAQEAINGKQRQNRNGN